MIDGRRRRALGFAAAAAICAGIAAGAAAGPEGGPDSLGELRPVVVADSPLAARRPISRSTATEALEVRRVPARFVAPDALASPGDAVGRRPVATIPPGAPLVSSQFAAARSPSPSEVALGRGRHPVEIRVAAAGALLSGRHGPPRRVDVIVTRDAGAASASGRTYVAAQRVGLLALREHAPDAAAPELAGDGSVATLALTRGQALRLIEAQSFAREIRLIGR